MQMRLVTDFLEVINLMQTDYSENSLQPINEKWRKFQLKSMFCYTLLILICEFIGYFVISGLSMLECSTSKYFLKYLLFPSGCNMLLTIFAWLLSEKTKVAETAKNYITCLSMVGIAFVVSVVHCAFAGVYSVFLIPVIMTMIYGDFRLISVTSLCSVVLNWISAMYIRWDASKKQTADLAADFMLSLFLLGGVFVACVVIIRFEKEKQQTIAHSEQERSRLQQELLRDHLTGVYNRLALTNALENLCAPETGSFFIAMMDIDDFKSINDTEGHLEGDAVLRHLGEVLTKDCPDAMPVRFGGDEFSVLFHERKREEVLSELKKVQKDFAQYGGLCQGTLRPTLSIGLAEWQQNMLPEELMRCADEALYESKMGKKNRLTVYSSEKK